MFCNAVFAESREFSSLPLALVEKMREDFRDLTRGAHDGMRVEETDAKEPQPHGDCRGGRCIEYRRERGRGRAELVDGRVVRRARGRLAANARQDRARVACRRHCRRRLLPRRLNHSRRLPSPGASRGRASSCRYPPAAVLIARAPRGRPPASRGRYSGAARRAARRSMTTDCERWGRPRGK